MEKIEFDFSELRGRIVTRYGNCTNFCRAINMGRAQLSGRLNNKIKFSPEEIDIICAPEILDIRQSEIGRVFFTRKV